MIFVNFFKRLSCGGLYSLSTILTLHVTVVTVSKYWLELGRMRLTELIYADTSLPTTHPCCELSDNRVFATQIVWIINK